MSKKNLLDTPGVQALVAAIYAKTEAEQAAIRQQIRTDLKEWIDTSIALTFPQVVYLDNMSEEALNLAGALIVDALENHAHFLYLESTPAVAARHFEEPQGKEILMGMKSMQRVGPTEEEEDLFLILVNYYGEESE